MLAGGRTIALARRLESIPTLINAYIVETEFGGRCKIYWSEFAGMWVKIA